MRLTVDHRTTYRFTAPQSRVVQLLRLTPGNTHDQTVASWRIHLDCDARLREGVDGFGNRVTMLYAEGPLPSIEIAVHGEVVTSHSAGVVLGVPEPLAPAVFRRATPATTADAAFGAWAGEGSTLDRLHRLNAALHARFTVAREQRGVVRPAAEVVGLPAASPRELAQLFCAGARALGVPARFVSGYHLWEVDGEHRPAPHGWAEAHVEGLGWIGFDPTTGLSPEETYVRVAVALDAAGAAPVAGSRLGEGGEELDVDVTVSREG